MTNFEYYIRRHNLALSLPEMFVINKFSNKPCTDITSDEIQRAKNIIRSKDVDISMWATAYWWANKGRKWYNQNTKKIWRNLGIVEWNLLERFYSSKYDEMES